MSTSIFGPMPASMPAAMPAPAPILFSALAPITEPTVDRAAVAAVVNPAILDTILGRLALLFLAGAVGDLTVARDAARQMLAAYKVETPDELRLAAEIISFGFHALEALSQASNPDMSLAKILRLRGSAVSLSREAHKAQRKLDQLQRDRRAGVSAQPAEAEQPAPPPEADKPSRPQIDKAIDLIAFTRDALESAGKNGGKSWTHGFQQRQVAKRITDNLKKNQLHHMSQAIPPNAALMSAAAVAPAG
jgi:hypothetical protein